jgi:hypothetical protein
MSGHELTTEIARIIEDVQAGLARDGFTEELFVAAADRLKAIATDRDEDLCAVLDAFLHLADLFGPVAPPELAELLAGQRPRLEERLELLRQKVSAAQAAERGASCDRLVVDLVHALKAGAPRQDSAARARRDMDAIQCGDDEFLLQFWTQARITAIESAHSLLTAAAEGTLAEVPNREAICALSEVYATGESIEPVLILQAMESVLAGPRETAEERKAMWMAVLPLLGTGLLFSPEASPEFDPIRDQLIDLMRPATAAPPASVRDQVEEIIAVLTVALEREGFSEYLFQDTVNRLKALHTGSADDHAAIPEALERVIDISLPFAPDDAKAMLQMMRSFIRQTQAPPGDQPPRSSQDLRAEGERIVRTLKERLEAGAPPEPTIAEALFALQSMALQVAKDDDEAGGTMIQLAAEVQHVIAPHVPDHLRHQFLESAGLMDIVADRLDDATSEDSVARALVARRLARQAGQSGRAINLDHLTELDIIPHVRHLLDLLPPLIDRQASLMFQEYPPGDREEIERVRKSFEGPLALLRQARSEEQVIQPQREGFRRAALDLQQFERRHHVMVVHPALPRNATTVDANCVFVSGSAPIEALVTDACAVIGMRLPARHSLANPLHGRWQQFRESALAVLDYSRYDPSRADPLDVPRSAEAERELLDAAAPTAAVAYETGWAYVLGTPVVVLARRACPPPFDIDVEPVWLEGDAGDVSRVIRGIQSALYGVPRGVTGHCLADTVTYIRQRYSTSADPTLNEFLSQLSPDDASRARLSLDVIVERASTDNAMVVVPTYAGGYAQSGRPQLFHVTAFRDWANAAQEEARNACATAGIEYRVGYEQLDPDILRAVWMDLCQASFVFVDITNLNPNAVLELAIAQAIGRPTLVVTQNRDAHKYLPAIEKLRVHHYDPVAGRKALTRLLMSWLPRHDGNST